jgi:hypothetical protein
MSSGNASGTEYGIRSVNTATERLFPQNGSRAALKGKTITATINVLKGGVLRGDQIPIRVTVNHTKHVRSLKGIIITLYRQARVDMHPALPVVANSKGDKKKTEDYYPKSRTGLGGLSLSSAGSSHLFRKDLSQSFAPLFVDPRTLTAEIKCAVRVPDEAFPTISNVPGAMISFKYYVEVVVDIQGKLTGLDRMVANAGLVNVPTSGGIAGMARDDATSTMFSTWGGNFVDTDQIRREKGVISSLFEVIIGTKDSERNGKRKQTQAVEVPINPLEEPITPYHDLNATDDYDQNYYDYDENGQYYDYGYDPAYYEAPGYEQHSAREEPSYALKPACYHHSRQVLLARRCLVLCNRAYRHLHQFLTRTMTHIHRTRSQGHPHHNKRDRPHRSVRRLTHPFQYNTGLLASVMRTEGPLRLPPTLSSTSIMEASPCHLPVMITQNLFLPSHLSHRAQRQTRPHIILPRHHHTCSLRTTSKRCNGGDLNWREALRPRNKRLTHRSGKGHQRRRWMACKACSAGKKRVT